MAMLKAKNPDNERNRTDWQYTLGDKYSTPLNTEYEISSLKNNHLCGQLIRDDFLRLVMKVWFSI
jgi:hypothetical protein